jgi:hypothetical protein
MAEHQPPPQGPPGGYGEPGYYAQQPPPQKKRGCGKAMLLALAAVAVVIVVAIVAVVVASDDDDGDTATDDATEGTEAPSADEDDSADTEDSAGVEGESDEIDDVTVDTCRNDPAVDWAAASGTATNDSSETSSYAIELNIVDSSGTIVGNATSFVENVPPGGDASWEALSTVALPEGGSCVLTSVDRTAA